MTKKALPYLLLVSTAFAEDGLYLGCGVNALKTNFAQSFCTGITIKSAIPCQL